MRIVHAVYGMDMGGMEVLVAQLCRIQRQHGHDVRVFAYSKLGVLGEQLRSEGFEVYVPGDAHPFVTMWRYFKCFQAQKPHVVHSHGLAPTIHATLGARLSGAQTVISTRHRVECFPYDRTAEMQYNVMCWFCDWVAGICESTCEQLRRGPFVCKKKVVRVYNGTEAVPESSAALRKDSFTVLFVGRLMPEKALDVLIRAVGAARMKVPGLKLWIVGKGAARAQLEALVSDLQLSDIVIFWGQQMNTAPFFRTADVFAMSSISEGLPMALLQSMSAGLPSIATDVDGLGEVLRKTRAGILTPIGDWLGMGEALIKVAEDAPLRHQLAERALVSYNADFTLECMAQNYMRLYTAK